MQEQKNHHKKLPRLLFITTRFLFPIDTGGQIRTAQILRQLNNKRFDITLVSPADRNQTKSYSTQIKTVCNKFISYSHPQRKGIIREFRRVISLWHRLPVSVASDKSHKLKKILRVEQKKDYDVIVYDFIHSAVNFIPINSVKTVMFTHNVEQHIIEYYAKQDRSFCKSFIWRSQFKKMKRFEDDSLRYYDRIISVSEYDTDYFQSLDANFDVKTIATGVDTNYFKYAAPNFSKVIIFVGSMDYPANIDGVNWFLKNVWENIKNPYTESRMKIIGRYPPQHLISRFSSDKKITFTGRVDDIYQESTGAGIFILPLRIGSGTRIKVFEALAMGIPVVSTTLGVKGLPVRDGIHFLRADTAQEFTDAIHTLFSEPEQCLRLSRQGRELVENNYTWEKIAESFANYCEFSLRQDARKTQ